MTKKMYVVAAVAMFAVLTVFGASSEARVMKFDRFSIDVPAGWRVNEDKENYTTSFVAPDESAALTVAIIENEGMSLEEYAQGIQKELKGKNLQESGGGYMFSFTTADGVDAIGIMSGDDNMVMLMTVIGEHDDFDEMVNSLETF